MQIFISLAVLLKKEYFGIYEFAHFAFIVSASL